MLNRSLKSWLFSHANIYLAAFVIVTLLDAIFLGHSTKEFRCDNGSNLRGGANELRASLHELKWDKILDQLSYKDVPWKHSLQFSPAPMVLGNDSSDHLKHY